VSYFDAAYIAKFYLDEPESDAVRRLAEHVGSSAALPVEAHDRRAAVEGATGPAGG
jgi:hypothetical protein